MTTTQHANHPTNQDTPLSHGNTDARSQFGCALMHLRAAPASPYAECGSAIAKHRAQPRSSLFSALWLPNGTVRSLVLPRHRRVRLSTN